jgi:hypothetical protein
MNNDKVIKDDRGKFKKGVCTNPNGRTKGSMNETTKKYMRIRNLAAEKYQEAFRILWECVEAKEAWAHQLFFKELVPKTLRQESIILDSVDRSIKGQIVTLTEGLAEFDHVTQDDMMERLKTLAAVKLSDQIDDNDTVVRSNRAALMDKVDRLEHFIELKKKEDKDE